MANSVGAYKFMDGIRQSLDPDSSGNGSNLIPPITVGSAVHSTSGGNANITIQELDDEGRRIAVWALSLRRIS